MLTRRGGYLQWSDDDAPAASRQLHRDGWVLLPGVLSPDRVTALADDIRRVYAEVPADQRRPERDPGELEQFRYEMLNRSASCREALADRAILDVVEPLLGEDCHIIANTAWWNPAGVEHTHGGGRWHIDAGPTFPCRTAHADRAGRRRTVLPPGPLRAPGRGQAAAADDGGQPPRSCGRGHGDRGTGTILLGLHQPFFYDG